MGQSLSAERANVQAQLRTNIVQANLQNALEQLDFLRRMADLALDLQEAALNRSFSDPAAQQNVNVVGTRAMQYERRHTVNVDGTAELVSLLQHREAW
jgi:hypothetical protein